MKEGNVDPELEDLRNDGLKSAPDPTEAVNQLKLLTRGIHVAWLFNTYGNTSLQSLCQSLSSVSPFQQGSWRDFFGLLKMSRITEYNKTTLADCIMYYPTDIDRTELCLRMYAQFPESTIDEIIIALHKLKRYDAINKLQPFLNEMVNEIKSEGGRQSWHIDNNDLNNYGEERFDSGFHSLSESQDESSDEQNAVTDAIIRPKGYELVKNHLPITLRELMARENNRMPRQEQSSLNNSPITRIENENYQQSTPIKTHVSAKQPYKKTVLVTFASDGQKAAYRIAAALRSGRTGDRAPFGVLILSENDEKIRANPEMLITSLFNQVDYVMPILTEGYLESLKSRADPLTSRSSDLLTPLDVSYVQYINDLMSKYYVSNSCRNDKFRCVIPDGCIPNTVLQHPVFQYQPTLKAWTYESGLEQLAKRLMEF